MVHRQASTKTQKRPHYPSPQTPGHPNGLSMVSAKHGSEQASPIRQSPRKASGGSRTVGLLPTPLSQSPSRPSPSTSTLHFPPSFDPASLHHTSSRYSAQQYTPFSSYRQSEYGRSGGLVVNGSSSSRGTLPRSKVERRLFDEEGGGDDGIEGGKGRNRGSSPLAPAFEANMILRTGAPVDLISWLRKNFHHVQPAENPPIPPASMSLLAIRTLLLERFPRVPEPDELAKSVLTAFPHGELDYPPAGSEESPSIRGLVWHGVDIGDSDDRRPGGFRTPERSTAARRGAAGTNGPSRLESSVAVSHSPTNSTLVSPTSSSAKQRLPNTPARSVLEEFADLATQTDTTPVPKTRSLPGEIVAPAPAYALANICNSFDITPAVKAVNGKKRARSKSPGRSSGRRRATTPDKLSNLLAAAEAVEGSPITSVLGHKRRRTIGGTGMMKDVMEYPKRNRQQQARDGITPFKRARGMTLSGVQEDGNGTSDAEDMADTADTSLDLAFGEPSSHTESSASSKSLSTVSNALLPGAAASGSSRPYANQPTASASGAMTPGGQSTASLPNNTPFPPPTRLAPRQRKANELPTEGDNPGVDCKPPYPYHELIRHAIETAPEGRLQLSQIYASIAERFPFFKTLDEKKTSGWQNSIRHNLSLKKMFVRVNKVDGVPDEAGKGGWWTVQPGVPDEGRPGRKAKAKRKAENGTEGGGSGDVSVEGMSVDGDRSEIGTEGPDGPPPSYNTTLRFGGALPHPADQLNGNSVMPGDHHVNGGVYYANGGGVGGGDSLSTLNSGAGVMATLDGREKAERWVKREDGFGLGPVPVSATALPFDHIPPPPAAAAAAAPLHDSD